MKNFKSTCMIAALAGAAFASSAMADGYATYSAPGAGFLITQISGDSGLNGGPGGSANSFVTFCVELNEFFTPGNSYYTQIATSASGGGNGGGNPDPIDGTTAKLYREFRSGGDFGTNLPGGLTPANAAAIQDAIWYSENELGSISGSALAIFNWAAANNDAALHGVRVIRSWTSIDANGNYSGNAQDMLTIVPTPTAALAGFGTLAGVGMLGAVRRRRNSAN